MTFWAGEAVGVGNADVEEVNVNTGKSLNQAENKPGADQGGQAKNRPSEGVLGLFGSFRIAAGG